MHNYVVLIVRFQGLVNHFVCVCFPAAEFLALCPNHIGTTGDGRGKSTPALHPRSVAVERGPGGAKRRRLNESASLPGAPPPPLA